MAARTHLQLWKCRATVFRNFPIAASLKVRAWSKNQNKNGPKATCCDFLYTMLGGSSEKYDIYEERCLTSE
ncbi:hypothetical protein IscW_ISCW018059 [Ixodes scapularis]|uniref:Uncharacterized protein n=1 Tax=Ixodes scapularis TaxID=6945 RepID=B7PK16_IXOSC|nr:hypothetical protein IscW_ISCW018059 [Ixodes scapularis]|eukprot:XP_002409131.1 hypothetical protein IscW_ISCW018059 [Ixodes scapularis]